MLAEEARGWEPANQAAAEEEEGGGGGGGGDDHEDVDRVGPRGPGDAVREALRGDPAAADLRLSLVAAALLGYRRHSLLRPFPSGYGDGGEDGKDFTALLADMSTVPSVQQLLREDVDVDPRILELLHWTLTSKNFTISSQRKDEFSKIEALTGSPGVPVPAPDFVFSVTYSDTAERRFREMRGELDILYAYHGSRFENFHSILHNGLHCHLNKTALFGEGTYLTSDLSLALLYSPHSQAWRLSTLGAALSCVAVCEVIDHPDVKCQVKRKDADGLDRRRARARHSEGGDVPQKYYVVTNNQLLRVRYLLLYARKSQHHSIPWQRSWLGRHRFAVGMAIYGLILLLLGALNSPTVLHYWRRYLSGD
ncbi:protein mono-ADP-ribosyltransferase PARP16 [Lethenteron reissneri]|uniref:protein mono-ADP-ribosyltransferase PARP16 n=1 Tax=Lethenteron reissneri TaxID=7753 RepID=UPI002AB68531|nr:protein mono-ADP-ribosyltransferase PARP16 [Lethenteron reissneri]